MELIKVSRQEADMIRSQLPAARVVTVNRSKSYKKYWAEESRGVLRLLGRDRGESGRRDRGRGQQPRNRGVR